MKSDRVYLDPELSLSKLSALLMTNNKYLSQVINHFTGSNFQGFINKYRVDEAKKRLRRAVKEKKNLEDLALECGFKNKATFYRAFKQETGKTPKGYLKG